MLKELVEEALALFGLFACSFVIIPFLMIDRFMILGLLATAAFAALLYFSATHIQKLFRNGKEKQPIIFLALIILTTAVTLYFTWNVAQPHQL